MRSFDIDLKEKYEFLGENGRQPRVRCYLPYCLKEMGRENEKRPCMVVCPGGGYAFCSEREAEPIALKFLSMGFNVFVLYYSCAPHRYPTQLREVAAVFEEIYAHADEWNCDTDKIGIIGFSAGGHLAAHYSNAYNCDEGRTVFTDSKKPAFDILCYSVITADEAFAHTGSFVNLLGSDPRDSESKKLSCEKLVTSDTPPAFIWHTANDECVNVKNSLCYAAALADNNVPFSLHIYPYGDHGLATCDGLTCNRDFLNEKSVLAYAWIEDFKKWFDITF